MKKIFVYIFLLFLSLTSQAQLKADDELKQLLVGKTKFYEIKTIVESFFKEKINLLRPEDSTQKKKINRQRKFWNRWFYESESRLNSNEEVENFAQKILQNQASVINSPQTAFGNWSHEGPTSVSEGIGRINRLAFDPVAPSTVYAGSSGGGLFKTETNGYTWESIGGFIPSLGISGIVVSYNNSQVIYVLTGDGDAFFPGGLTNLSGYMRYSVGVLKSTDGGNTWNQTGAFPGLDNVQYVGFQLTQDPLNANVLLAATSKGLYRTTNGGASWNICDLNGDNNLTNDKKRVWDIKYKPGNSSVVYCAYKEIDGNENSVKFTLSGDGGISFNSSGITYDHTIDNADRIVIGVTPANSSYVYLLCSPGYTTDYSNNNNTFEGLYRSTNSGQNFTRRSNSPDILGYSTVFYQYGNQGTYDLALAVSPVNANIIATGGLVIWNSHNGGLSWDDETDYHWDLDNSNYMHSDVHDLRYNPLNGLLFTATDGGVSISGDDGTSWNRVFAGLNCTQFYHFGAADDDGNIWGGAQDNGILRKNGGASSFNQYAGGDGYDVLTDLPPAGNQNDKYYSVNEKVYADAIVDVNITPPGANNFFANLAMSPTNEDVIYAGYEALYVSYSRGSNWASFDGTELPHYEIPGNWCISTCPTNRKRIYTAGANSSSNSHKGLWRIDNLDDAIPDVAINLTNNLEAAGYPGSHPKITDIEVSSSGSNVLWVTIGGYEDTAKVFYSTSSGISWTNITGSLPNLPVNCIISDDNNNVYIGTDNGVYYRGSGDADWTPFYNGLPRVPVSELEISPVAPHTILYASTYGRGIWSSLIFTECISSLNISSTQQGQKFYQAGTSITSSSTVSGGTGTNVFFRAGSSVTLEPGFIVNPGSEFKGYIGPCNSGPVPFKTANVDSSINVINNIKAARQYGFVDDAITDGQNVTLILKMFDAGSYTIRVYDIAMGAYVASLPVYLDNGNNTLSMSVKIEKDKNFRADLFKEDMLVHKTDILIK